MIVIVDYGMGNIRSVYRALKQAAPDKNIVLSKAIPDIMKATHLVLPGQGAMKDCMQALHQSGLKNTLLEAMQIKPTLGICIGMHMLFEHSEEDDTPGLAMFQGKIVKLPNTMVAASILIGSTDEYMHQKVPHMGWNDVNLIHHNHQITPKHQHPVWQNIPKQAQFYFVHSYYLPMNCPHALTSTHYGVDFTSAIACRNIVATQFHPEKSGNIGLQFCKNFLDWDGLTPMNAI